MVDQQFTEEDVQRRVEIVEKALQAHFHGPGYTAEGHSASPDECWHCHEAALTSTPVVLAALVEDGWRNVAREKRQLDERIDWWAARAVDPEGVDRNV